MAVNADKVERWKEDVNRSVDFYNEWFLTFAPQTYRETRTKTTKQVEDALHSTNNLRNLSIELLKQSLDILQMFRMVTAPPLARDRLIGLAYVTKHLVETMEIDKKLPPKAPHALLNEQLERIVQVILKLTDKGVLTWLDSTAAPTEAEVHRAATVITDRLTGAVADPVIRSETSILI